MFPWLFPYGYGGIGQKHHFGTISETTHKHNLLMYHDKHFQTDFYFPMIAFNHEVFTLPPYSTWNPCGFHVIPGGFHPFHMEYVLAGIPLIFLIPFHFDSIWNPYGIHLEWSYSIIIPWNVPMESTWNGYGFHME